MDPITGEGETVLYSLLSDLSNQFTEVLRLESQTLFHAAL